jgi:predicted transcriptional regulator
MRIREFGIIEDENLTASEIVVLFVIKLYINININKKVGAYTDICHRLIAKKAKISRNTVIRILNSLVKKGWITVEKRKNTTSIYRFPKDKCFSGDSTEQLDVTSHYITKAKIAENVTAPVQSEDITMSNDVTGGCNMNVHIGYIGTETKKDSNQEKNLTNKTGAAKAAPPESSKSLPASVEKKQQNSSKVSYYDIWLVWDKAIKETFHDNKFVPPFTNEEKGMLKNFMDKSKPHNPIEILKHTVENWSSFVDRLHVNNIWKNGPKRPVVGFLLKHVGYAVNFYLNEKEDNMKKCNPGTKKPDNVINFNSALKRIVYGVSEKDIETQWYRVMKMRDDSYCDVKSFKMEHHYAAKDFVKQITSVNPLEAFSVCVFEWESYKDYLADNAGYKYLGGEPDLYFVLTHSEHAVAYYNIALAKHQAEEQEEQQNTESV